MNRTKSNRKLTKKDRVKRAERNERRGRTKAFIKGKQWEQKHVIKEGSRAKRI